MNLKIKNLSNDKKINLFQIIKLIITYRLSFMKVLVPYFDSE